MNIFQSIILGIIQGLTEFLPISSTAHLRIVPALLGWNDPGAAFTAVIQFGTLVAVFIYFRKDILAITGAVIKSIQTRNISYNREAILGWMIAFGTIPIVFFGLLFKKNIETNLRSLYVISASMIILAVVLMIAETIVKKRDALKIKQKSLDDISWRDAILIGFAQAVALIPGSSRSGTTITGGLFIGLNRETSARFSFLLSLPSIFAAGMLELVKERELLLSSDIGFINLAVATIVSGIVGYASIAFLLNYLKTHSTYIFIVYRIIVGFGLLYLLNAGILSPL
ncbi:MAG TPA: undecaprenyl-diphosphatase UppP [Bacteroidetes bacterium]|nr:undecaprenyl-diphosphatase UppP [Bacteroidota bacterium]